MHRFVAHRYGVPNTPAAQDPGTRRALTLARWLDQRWIDPVIGLLLPEVGDLLTAGAGLTIVATAVRRGLPAVVVARMLLNLGLDLAIGAVPVVGDLLDFVFKANVRNARLLEQGTPGKSKPGDWLVVAGAGLVFLMGLALPIVAMVWLVSRLVGG